MLFKEGLRSSPNLNTPDLLQILCGLCFSISVYLRFNYFFLFNLSITNHINSTCSDKDHNPSRRCKVGFSCKTFWVLLIIFLIVIVKLHRFPESKCKNYFFETRPIILISLKTRPIIQIQWPVNSITICKLEWWNVRSSPICSTTCHTSKYYLFNSEFVTYINCHVTRS